MSVHRPAPAQLPAFEPPPGRRKLWPFIAGGTVAGLLVVAVIAAVAVRRDAGPPAPASAVLAEGVTAGGRLDGQARALAEALVERGLDCSVRFTGAEGGHAGCFLFRETGRITAEAIYQYRPDGTIIGLNIKVTAAGGAETAPTFKTLVTTVAPVVFPADPKPTGRILREWGGWADGSWGAYEFISRGPKTSLSARKADSTPIKVPVIHLDTTETALADGLRADGFACSRDNETCRGKYAGRPGLTAQMSGPDTGITYFLASAAVGGSTQEAFDELRTKLFGHLDGSAVEPLNQWLSEHLDGRSHIAYVGGWRVDLQVFHSSASAIGNLRLTIFNEEYWEVPE